MSENQLDLGEFLQQHVEDGVKDSEGGFTVSHTNAARKLAKFALPRPYAWVSKFVQAAVAWECESLRIAQGRELTVFFFKTEHLSRLPTEQELVSTMLSGKVGGTGPLDSFCTGLRSLVEQTKLSFLLVLDDGEVIPKPVYAGYHFAQLSEEQRLSSKFRPGPGIALTVAHIPSNVEKPVLGRSKYQLKIVEELDKYCYMCPIPIRVDGLQIDGPLRSSQFSSSDRHRPLLTGGVPAEYEEDSVLPLPPDFEDKNISIYTHSSRALRSYGGAISQDCSAAFVVGWHLPRLLGDYDYPQKRFSSVHWVRHGVIVESTKLPLQTYGLGCHIFLSAENLKTDLTGFQLVETQQRANRETEGVRRVGTGFLAGLDLGASAFREDRDGSSGDDEQRDLQKASKKRIKILLKGSGAGLFLTLLNPPIGLPVTIGSIVAAYFPRGSKTNSKLIELQPKLLKMLKTDQTNLVKTLSNWTVLPPEDSLSETDQKERLESALSSLVEWDNSN